MVTQRPTWRTVASEGTVGARHQRAATVPQRAETDAATGSSESTPLDVAPGCSSSLHRERLECSPTQHIDLRKYCWNPLNGFQSFDFPSGPRLGTLLVTKRREFPMKTKKTIGLIACLLVGSNCVAATMPPAVRDIPRPKTSPSECMRLLVATSRRLVAGLEEPTTASAEGRATFGEKRAKLISAFDAVLQKGHEPTQLEIARLHHWLECLFVIGRDNKIHDGRSEEAKALSICLSLAQGYLDCASRMALAPQE